jgi:hypothetical protein
MRNQKRQKRKKYTWADFDREQAAMRYGSKGKPRGKLYCPTDFQQLRKRCLASIRDFHSEGEVVNTPDGIYIYRDNGANVLAVAHLDVVQPEPRHFGHRKGESDVIYNCQLDDRLGAWIILDLLPSIGINVDVLLTTGEESCRSTAAHFCAEKDYNWLIEFDRAGTDVVMYDYETPELVELLCHFGNDVSWGSYSDISVLEHLGVAGFNWGTGYHDNHWRNSHFIVSECMEAIGRFIEFYEAHKSIEFPYFPCEEKIVNESWLREEDKEWIREMEARQKLGEEDTLPVCYKDWDEEYWQLWREQEEREQWEQERWGQKELDWEDCFTTSHYHT